MEVAAEKVAAELMTSVKLCHSCSEVAKESLESEVEQVRVEEFRSLLAVEMEDLPPSAQLRAHERKRGSRSAASLACRKRSESVQHVLPQTSSALLGCPHRRYIHYSNEVFV